MLSHCLNAGPAHRPIAPHVSIANLFSKAWPEENTASGTDRQDGPSAFEDGALDSVLHRSVALCWTSPSETPTYNFEVDGLHTYVAGGLRVHNDSILDFVPDGAQLIDIGFDTTGLARFARYIREDGVTVEVTGAVGSGADTVRLHEKLTFGHDTAQGDGVTITQERLFDQGVETGRKITGFEYGPGRIELEQIGSILGSTVGSVLGGNSLVGQVAAGTIIGTVTQNLGELLQKGYDISQTVLDGAPGTDNPLAQALDITWSDFGYNLASSLQSQLSNLLMAELAEALGLRGLEGRIFTSIGGTVTAQLLQNAYNIATFPGGTATASPSLFDGFSPGQLLGNVAGVVGGYLGNYLAGQILSPDNKQAAIGTQIGSAVGAYIGSVLIPIPGLGTFVGAFLGNLLGTTVGNAFGVDSKAWGQTYLNRNSSDPDYYGGFYGRKNGGDVFTFARAAQAQADAVNTIVDLIGAKIVGGNDVGFYQKGTTFTIFLANGEAYDFQSRLTPNWAKSDAWASAVDRGAMSILNSLNLEGGDPFRRLAFDKSPATNVSALLLDLKIAEDYKKYLMNTTAINALIAVDPDSPIAAGWTVTLLRAKELGLTAIQKFQFTGTIAADSMRGSSLRDLIRGEEGDDKIFGGTGEDSIHGGTGNDLVDGGSGNDHLFGGDGHDFLEGGPGDDVIDGGPGSDTAALSGAQDDYLILRHGGRLIVAGPDGVDEMTGVETLQFRSPTGTRTQRVDVLPDNAWAYLASYPDLILAIGLNASVALDHFKNHGFDEGRRITFDAQTYLAGYRDLQAAFGSDGVAAAWHYVAHGYREGRVLGLLGTAGNDELVGSSSNDRIFGYAGNDHLFGGDGHDFLEGGPGDDVIDGGPGSDVLTGSEGGDNFIFTFMHAGEDTLRDFDSASGDKIGLQLDQSLTAEHVLGLARQDGTDTIIPVDGDTFIRLNNVLKLSLKADDFFIV